MDRLLKCVRASGLLLLLVVISLCGNTQSIILPSPIDSLINLKGYVDAPFSFTSTSVEDVSLYTGLNAAHCKLSGDCGTLPVYLLSFDGKRIDREHALLNWKTTNEINSKGFEVERALATTHNFTSRGFVASLRNGGNEKKYQFRDDNNFPGISYYRLKQVDNDGQFNYSEIVEVKGFDFNDSLLLYPNPTRDYLNIHLYMDKAVSGTLLITDLAGKTLLSKQVKLGAGDNFNRVSVAGYKAGVYTLKLIKLNEAPMIRNFVKY